jgi:Glycosyl transferases group 1
VKIINARRLKLAADPRTWVAMASDVTWAREAPCPVPGGRSTPAPRPLVRWPARYEYPLAGLFVGPIKEGFEALATVLSAEIAQPYKGIVVFEIDQGDGPRRVAIDYYDFTFVNPECAAEVDTYFKFQYLPGGYPEFDNVYPGGYVTDKPFLYAHWCRLRALRQKTNPTSDAFGRFSLRFGGPLRAKTIGLMQAEPRINFAGGTRRTQKTRYLREMARARVCIDLPGQGPLCCRLIEGLAMGCCIVAAPHAAEMPVPLREGVEILYCREDLSDLAELCVAYARDEDRRAPIEAAAGRYFDEHLHPVRMAERYLRQVAVSGVLVPR